MTQRSQVVNTYTTANCDVLFKSKDGTILSLPASVIDSWTPAQKAWVNSTPAVDRSGQGKLCERYAKLAYEVYYYRKNGVKLLEMLPISPKSISRFQFWLRSNLEQMGLI